MVADPTTNGRKGVFLLDEFEGLTIFAGGHQRDITLHADMGGTFDLARSNAPFRYSKGTRYGLGIFFKCGLSPGQTLIVLIGQ